MLVENLIFLWHVMKAAENLLVQAISCTPAGELRVYFEHHLTEERGHAEWLAEDLASVGINVRKTPIPREACEMVGTVYYMIFHADPAALLGYMHVLESWPMPEQRFIELEREYPPSLLRTARHHAKHDPEHLADLDAVIASLSPERRKLVDQTQHMTLRYIRQAAEALMN